jgi:hypothetical protein
MAETSPNSVRHGLLAFTLVLTALGLLFTGSTIGAVLGLGLLGLALSLRFPADWPDVPSRSYLVGVVCLVFWSILGILIVVVAAPFVALYWLVRVLFWSFQALLQGLVWLVVGLTVGLPLLTVSIGSGIAAIALWVPAGLFAILSWLFRPTGLGRHFAALRQLAWAAAGRMGDISAWCSEKPSAIGHRWLRGLHLEPRLTRNIGSTQ